MLCLPRKRYPTVRQILISDVHWEFSKKGTQETVVILTLVSGTENVDNGKDNVFHCEPFVLFQFVPENTISQREKKKKNSKKSPCSFIHIHKEKRIHRYADFKAWHWGLPSRKRENKYNSHPETEFPCRQNVKYPQISNCIELHKTGKRFSLEKGFWTNLEKASFPFRNERLLSQGQADKVKGKANVSRSFPLR